MLPAILTAATAFCVIILLALFKRAEIMRGRALFAPKIRSRLDRMAMVLKRAVLALMHHVLDIPGSVLHHMSVRATKWGLRIVRTIERTLLKSITFLKNKGIIRIHKDSTER